VHGPAGRKSAVLAVLHDRHAKLRAYSRARRMTSLFITPWPSSDTANTARLLQLAMSAMVSPFWLA